MEFSTVLSDQIDLDDRLFWVHNSNAVNMASQTIETLYNPVWLQQKEPGRYRIVDGFLMIPALMGQIAAKAFPARIFDQAADTQALWHLRIQKRLAEQNLTPFALLSSLETLLTGLQQEQPSLDILSLVNHLGFSHKGFTTDLLSETLHRLTSQCQFCDLHALTYREIYGLSRRKPDELQAFSTLFQDLKLKGNKLQSILQIMDELAKGYNLPPQTIVTRKETQTILQECPVHLKYKTLKSYLSTLRWPVLEKTQKKWQQLVKKFNIQGKLTISTDPLFEANEIDIHLRVSDPKDYTALLSTLNSYSTDDEFFQLFDFV